MAYYNCVLRLYMSMEMIIDTYEQFLYFHNIHVHLHH